MKIIPAIDIMDGKLVRLTNGLPSTKQQYSITDPLEAAKDWENKGAEIIHLIDLDAALNRIPNIDLILKISKSINTPLQVGGGVRSIKIAKILLDAGVERIILGSMSIKYPDQTRRLLEMYESERIIIALDHKNGYLQVNGWQKPTEYNLFDMLQNFRKIGFQLFLVTNINRDGTLSGPDFKTYSELSHKARILASGGVGTLDDIKKLSRMGLDSVVIGKAFYENRFTLHEAKEAAGC